MWYLYEYWDSNGWYKFMDIGIYKITDLQDFSSCKPNEEWPHIALPCYSETEK